MSGRDYDIDLTCDKEPYEDDYEDHSYFTGNCTCDHDEDRHSWGECGINDCTCQAGWEE